MGKDTVTDSAPSPSASRAATGGFNVGWALLRPFMCFEVILAHFWQMEDAPPALRPFVWFTGLAVPVFMMLSFYLTSRHIFNSEKKYIRRRIWRVGWPLVGWAVIYWLVQNILSTVTDLSPAVGIGSLLWQCVTGHAHDLNPSMWYQAVLVLLTIAFSVLFMVCGKNGLKVLFVLALLALGLQYSGLNEQMFSQLRYELKYPLGRISEMLPFAVIGFTFGYYDVLPRMARYKNTIVLCAIMLGALALPLLRRDMSAGFGYFGILYIIVPFCLFIAAYYIPFSRLTPKDSRLFRLLTSYTLGIYCMHRLMAKCLLIALKAADVEIDSFALCVLTYVLGWALCALIARLPWRPLRQLVN